MLLLLCLQLHHNFAEQLCIETRNLILQLTALLEFVGNVHIARHVDIDGIRREPGDAPSSDLYTQTVENARSLIRTLEAAMQSLYDDGSSFLLTAQAVRHHEPSQTLQQCNNVLFDHLAVIASTLKANIGVVLQSVEALLSIGHDQADMAQGDYNGSIEWRMSRLSIIDTQFGGAHRPLSNFASHDEDVVDMELAFQKPGIKAAESHRRVSETTATASVLDTSVIDDSSSRTGAGGSISTLVPLSPVSPIDSGELFDEECECSLFPTSLTVYLLQPQLPVAAHLEGTNSKSYSVLMLPNIISISQMRKQNLGICGQLMTTRRFSSTRMVRSEAALTLRWWNG
jgi:son of sevenless-like protein